MTTIVRCPLSIPISEELRQTCVNSAAIACGIASTVSLSILAVRTPTEHMDPRIAFAIVAVPLLGSRVIQRFLPRTNALAINLGAAIGMAIPCAVQYPTTAYVVGSVVSTVMAGLLAAMEIGPRNRHLR